MVWLTVCGALCGCKDKTGNEDGESQTMETAVQKLNENFVDTMVLHKVVFNKQIKCNGKLRAVAKSELAMPTGGVLHAIYVKNGTAVKKGDLLASVDKCDAKRELEKAEQDMEKARVELVDKLIGQGYDDGQENVPEQILRRAKITSGYTAAEYALQTARLNLERCDLHAPFSGRVADMDCKLYQQPKEKFCTLIDDSSFDVEFSILEAELQSVGIGQHVTVSPFVRENEVFTGRVVEINPSIDEKGQVMVRARIRNRGGLLMEGMNVKVVIDNYPEGQREMVEVENNPEDPAAGTRQIPFSRELYIEREDFMENAPKKFFRMTPGNEVRLKGAYIVRCTGVEKDPDGQITLIHCTAIEAEVRLYDRLFKDPDPAGHKDIDFKEFLNENSLQVLHHCKLEPSLRDAREGDRFQFQRLGYFCVDKDSRPGALVFNRTVGLKDTWAKLNN